MKRTQTQKILQDDRFKVYARSLRRKTGINFFRVLAVDGYEIRHSNFLAWLLDPIESHKLGTLFLSDLLASIGCPRKQYSSQFLKETIIWREKDHLDILILNERLSLLICIENKVGSPEGYKQLQQYRQYIKKQYAGYETQHFIYLTLPNSAPSSDGANWHHISYTEIALALKRLKAASSNKLVLIIIDMYLETLDDLLVNSLGGSSLAYELYNDHQKTLRKISKKQIAPPKLSGIDKKAFTALTNMVDRDDESLIESIFVHTKQIPGVEASRRTGAIYFSTGPLRKLRKSIGLEGHLLYCFVVFSHAIAFQMYLHPATKYTRLKWNKLRDWIQSQPISDQVFENDYGYFTFYEEHLLDLTAPITLPKEPLGRFLESQCNQIFAKSLPRLEKYIEKYVNNIRKNSRPTS